ncbi:MAG: glycosyltransferase [Candidatus Eisenbacteria bacterium]|jgi:lipopolysaccharide/colanic/teichoic acid biosynthesis glycosyltransferase/GT2 family glycosyltransferase|nr:glycosyltransferase [Candidatus Eisenbacteria bacterium]
MISVVIPAFNASATIEATLRALQGQTLPRDSFEVIVVDDGSTDSTTAIAGRFADRVVSQERAGPAAARNHGARLARGDILVFTDSDCEADPEWLARLTTPMSDPEVVAVKGAYRTRQRRVAARFAQVEFEERYRRLRGYHRIDFVDSYSAAIRAESFRSVGGFDLRFPKANNEDVDLSYKLAARGAGMVFAPDAIVYHRHPNSVRRYLRTKFLRAYWRAMVYRRHPAKLLADSYTPQLLKIQAALAPLTCLLGAGAAAGMIPWLIPAAAGAVFAITTLPLMAVTAHSDRPLVPLVLPLAIGRALALGAGGAAGALAHRERDRLIPALLVAADSLAVLAAFVLAFLARTRLMADALTPFAHGIDVYLRPLPVVLCLWLAAFAYLNLYAVRVHTTPFVEFIRVARGSVFSLLVIMSLSFLAKFDYSRVLVLLYFILVVPLTVSLRSAVRLLQHRLLLHGYRTSRCLIVGTGETARDLVDRMLRYPSLGYTPVGIVSELPPDTVPHEEVPWVGRPENISGLALTLGVDEVFISDPSLAPVETMALALACDAAGTSCKVVSRPTPLDATSSEVTSLTNLSILDLSRPRFGPVQEAIKTTFDGLVASIVLLAFAPLAILYGVSLAIRSIRPLLITEERVGKGGHHFTTTRLTIPASACFIDRCVRRIGLDRVPRLMAVLRGDMSLVGPRGESPDKIAAAPHWERVLLEVRPGLTGLWLVGRTGDVGGGSDVEHDFFYLRNRSLLLDVVIILRSIPALWKTRTTA